MTALTMSTAPGRDATVRPVPWRRMAWVTWRQHRATVAGVVAVLCAASVYLYITGDQIHHQGYVSYGEGPGLTLAAALFQVIAPLIGAFVGAPLLARELETGTFRFTWTQGFGRARWAVATLVPLAVAVAVVAGAFGLVFSWCYGQQISGRYGLSPLEATTFDLHGVAIAGWTLVAFAIGVLAGTLIRRVVPAMFATIVAWSGLAVVTGVFLRPHYEAPLVSSKINLPNGAWVMSQRWTRGGRPVSVSTVNQVLQKVGAGFTGQNNQVGPLHNSSGFAPPSKVNLAQYLVHHGFALSTIYQPASRFWPFQWIEAGWLLALSVVLMAATVWLVHRRAT